MYTHAYTRLNQLGECEILCVRSELEISETSASVASRSAYAGGRKNQM